MNANPSPSAHISFPTWRQLSLAMFDEIYPTFSDGTADRDSERLKLINGKGPLRLASEYEAAFDPQSLQDFLRAKIPDSTHEPGELHGLLLRLPWKDVFTTNYDTLLERTDFAEKAYQLVTKADELATATSPRIIKLHGSFPSQTPFIITEEHYRTYPKNYAPFINTVRQSLLENALVLIGFSGDDPNFLEWTGWIRDELGDQHAPIYLISTSPLSHVDRSLLAQRDVTPIDLGSMFASKTSPSVNHSTALEWFLRSLQAQKPPRPERWPHANPVVHKSAEFDPPLLIGSRVEPEVPRGNQSSLDESTVIKIIERWRFERNEYPGWLVPADNIRSELRRETNSRFFELIRVSREWLAADKVLLFRELLWRFEASMLPLDDRLIEPLESVVNELFPSVNGVSRLETPDKLDRVTDDSIAEVSEAWLEVTFALLRNAREDYDPERWKRLREMIDSVVANHTQHKDRYHYEEALWLIWNLERDQARELLETWVPSLHSPRAVMWKAGLLAELEELGKARSLLRSVLREIRVSLQNTQGQNIGLLSSEGWCTYLLLAVESTELWEGIVRGTRSPEEFAKLPELREGFWGRWQELKAWDCDPRSIMEYFDKVLLAEPAFPKKEKQVIHGFDPGHRKVRYSLFGGPDTRWLPAFSYLRLHEQIGIPLRFSNDTLKNASKWLAPFIEFWSPTLLIRAGKVKEFLEHGLLTRTRVAYMEDDLAKRLNQWAMDAFVREISNMDSPIPFQSVQTSLLEVLIEFLSRLAIKLETEDLDRSFALALGLHRLPEFYAHIRLNESCGPWFRRLFRAASDRQLLIWLPDLLRFPLSRGDAHSLDPDVFPWPDPIVEFPVKRASNATERFPELLSGISDAIDWLLAWAKDESGDERQRALRRLVTISELMTKAQQRRLGSLLWKRTGTNGLPDLPDLYSYNYFSLPAPKNIDVVSKVKESLISLAPLKSFSQSAPSTQEIDLGEAEDRMVPEVARATKPVVQLPLEAKGKIEWSINETKELWEKVLNWWENDKKALAMAGDGEESNWGIDRIVSRLEGIDEFLVRIVLPSMDIENKDEVDNLLNFLSETRRNGVYLTTALPYLLLHPLDKKKCVTRTILRDLTLGADKEVRKSAQAVRHWIHLADAGLVEHPRDAVLNKLIERVIFRRREGIKACLQNLAFLLAEKPTAFSLEQANLIASCLVPWHDATYLPVSEQTGDFPEEESLDLRVLVGSLASSLSDCLKSKHSEQREPSGISFLKDKYRSDPLPEVRRSFGSS